MNAIFLNLPQPYWEIHMDWENDAKCHHIVGPCPPPPPFIKGGVGPSKN